MDERYIQLLYVVFGLYILLLSVAAVFDAWKFIIPNAVTVGLVVLFLATALLLPFEIDWLSHIGAAVAVFAGGAAMFFFGRLGGGDVKLLTAVALWFGFENLPELLLYVVLAGGALTVGLIILRRVIVSLGSASAFVGNRKWPRVLLTGENVPYALAIAPASIFLGATLPHLGGYILLG